MVYLKNIDKSYSEQIVLKDFNLNIESGELVGVMGESGAGKSTLLNIIGTVDTPTSGSYFFNDIDILKLKPSQVSRFRNKNIGFIFQQYNLIPNISTKENILLPYLFGKMKIDRDVIDYFDQICEEFKISDLLNKNIDLLSGGEKQRVSIARAIIKKADLILADEPTGNLDATNKQIVIDMLLKLNKQGKTIIIVTHDRDIFEICSNKLLLAKGENK